MSMSINEVTLLGYLGADPEMRTFQNGDQIATMRLATSESWKDPNNGERREKSEWHTIVVKNKNLVRVAEQYLRSGTKAFVKGKLETRKWHDQSGQDRYSTEIVLVGPRCDLIKLDPKEKEDGQ